MSICAVRDFPIIDFHTHPFLNEEQNLCFYQGTSALNPQDMRAQLERVGIGHIAGSVIARDRATPMRRLNDMALELRDRLGDFYTPGFHIHPANVDESIAEIERMHAQGVHLIGELVPYMHGWGNFAQQDWTQPLSEILDAAQQYGMAFSYHSMWEWPLDELISTHPGISFIAAHPDERDSVMRHIERMQTYPNTFLDLSGTGIFRFGVIRHMVREVGAERILFGTDYPICNPEMYVHAVLGEELDPEAEALILNGNARRILKIGRA